MKIQEFVDNLKVCPEEFSFYPGEHRGKTGFFVENRLCSTLTHFTDESILTHKLPFLILRTHQGKNLENITRITGYFSRTTHWNKGKKAELKDRARVGKQLR